jgi:DNA gyrase subunit A
MILEGLMAAMDQLDAVIKLIRSSNSTAEAKSALMKFLSINKEQAQAIIDVRLGTLTRMDIKKLKKELGELNKQIAKWEALLASDSKMDKGIIADLNSMIDEEDDRLTAVQSFETLEYSVKVDKVIVCGEGMKYSTRKRIGKFVGPYTRTSTADMVISILRNGMCRNFHAEQTLSIKEDAEIVEIISGNELMKCNSVVFVTTDGMVKRTAPGEVVSGKNLQAILKLKNEAQIVSVHLVAEDSEIFLETNSMAIRFRVSDVHITGRVGIGVGGIKLSDDDVVINSYTDKEIDVYGRSDLANLKIQKRAGKGSKLNNS